MLLSFATYTCSAQFFNVRNNNWIDKAFGVPTALVNESAADNQTVGCVKCIPRCNKFNKEFCEQSRVQRHSLSFFLLTCHTRNGLSARAKSFSTTNSSSKALPNGKCGARNTCFYFIVVLFYSTGQSSSLDAVFYSIGLRSLYVDRGLKRQNGSFLFV